MPEWIGMNGFSLSELAVVNFEYIPNTEPARKIRSKLAQDRAHYALRQSIPAVTSCADSFRRLLPVEPFWINNPSRLQLLAVQLLEGYLFRSTLIPCRKSSSISLKAHRRVRGCLPLRLHQGRGLCGKTRLADGDARAHPAVVRISGWC